jgi:hypothetical protein
MKYLVLSLLIAISMSSFGQDVYFGYKLGYLNMNSFSERRVQGLQLDIVYPDNHLGIHYEILWGKRYFHMPAGPVGGYYLGKFLVEAVDSNSKGRGLGLLVALASIALPEGISYNVKVNERFEFAPYLSPLQFVDINDKGKEYATAMAGSLGVRFNFYNSDRTLRFSPFIEGQLLYKKGDYSGMSFGATASVRFASD